MSSAFRSAIRRARASEFGGLAGDSFYVGIWQGAISVADLVQIALITHALGLHEYGRLAIVISFVMLVGQFFDVRVGAAATTFGARRLGARDAGGATGVFQLSYLIDASTGIIGFAVVAALSPLVGPHLVGDGGTTLILLFGLTLLISTVDESSITVLRVLDRFRLIAVYTTALQALRVACLVAALLISHSLIAVLIALVAFDIAGAIANASAAAFVFRRATGRSLTRSALGEFRERRQMVRMVFHTNVVSYARLAQVQLPTLLVGALSGATQAGLFKVGTAAGAIIGRLADPAYGAVLPRLARLWAAGRVGEIRRLIRRASLVAAPTLAAALLVLVLLREPALRLLGGSGGTRAGAVLVLVAIAQAVNGALFWNVGLLFAAGRSGTVSLIAVVGAVLQGALLVPLVVFFDANGAAAAFLATMVGTNLVAALLALRVLGRADDTGPKPAPVLAVPLSFGPGEAS
jgi:O-antigen/teichoic acid export membrane protein